jgi:hypothetical protein
MDANEILAAIVPIWSASEDIDEAKALYERAFGCHPDSEEIKLKLSEVCNNAIRAALTGVSDIPPHVLVLLYGLTLRGRQRGIFKSGRWRTVAEAKQVVVDLVKARMNEDSRLHSKRHSTRKQRDDRKAEFTKEVITKFGFSSVTVEEILTQDTWRGRERNRLKERLEKRKLRRRVS